MKKFLSFAGVLIGSLTYLHAQDSKNGRDVSSEAVREKKGPKIIRLDTVPPAGMGRFKPIEIPNAWNVRPLATKDISVRMPTVKLSGKDNVFMPGTEALDKLDTTDVDLFRKK